MGKWTIENKLKDNVKNYLEVILKNVEKILLIISHNDDDHNNLLNYLIQYSSYPVLNIISSKPDNKNGKPSYIMIENLINEIIESNKVNYKHNKNFCCIPHNISCNLNGEIFKYPSIKKEFLMPIFITGDARSSGYNIVIDSERMILRDNITIYKLDKENIDIPLYIYSASKINYKEFNVKEDIIEDLIKLYSHYITENNLKEFKTEFRDLPNKVVIKKNIIYNNFNKKLDYMEYLVIKLKRCNLINKVNDGTNKIKEQYKKIEQSNKMLKYNNNINNFIQFSLMMKQTNENIKEFLYGIFENDKETKKVIDETINNCNEIGYGSSNNYSVIDNMINQNKKRKIG